MSTVTETLHGDLLAEFAERLERLNYILMHYVALRFAPDTAERWLRVFAD